MVPRHYRYTKPVCSNDRKIDEKLSWKESTGGSREENGEGNGALWWGKISKYVTRVHENGLMQLCVIMRGKEHHWIRFCFCTLMLDKHGKSFHF